MTRTSAQDLQEEFLTALRKGQKTMIDALRIWVDTVTSSVSPLTDKLPKPNVTMPFAGQLPTPEEAVDSAYRLAELLLASQRRFAEDVLDVTVPLLSGHLKTVKRLPGPSRNARARAQGGRGARPGRTSCPRPGPTSCPRPGPTSFPSRRPSLCPPRRRRSPPPPAVVAPPPRWRSRPPRSPRSPRPNRSSSSPRRSPPSQAEPKPAPCRGAAAPKPRQPARAPRPAAARQQTPSPPRPRAKPRPPRPRPPRPARQAQGG